MAKGEELLLKIHHAIVSVPNRGKVHDALQSLGATPPLLLGFP